MSAIALPSNIDTAPALKSMTISERAILGMAYQRELSRKGFVYFMAAASGVVKIGFSADPERRRRELQCWLGEPLKVWLLIEGCHLDEAAYHRRFAGSRLAGEWYALSNDIASFVVSEWNRC